jgi:predicted dehydrogenase
LGEQIYEALTEDPVVTNQFNKLGIRVRKASSKVQLHEIWYSRPLAESVKLGEVNPLYRLFLLSGSPSMMKESDTDSKEIPEPEGKMHVEEERWCELGPRFLEPGRTAGQPAQRDIQILIEGAGAWVENAFIPSIRKAREELDKRRQQGQKDLRDLKVIIADDSRWHTPGGSPPVIPNSQHYPKLADAIQAQEILFLDKAAPADLRFYRGLNPGVVFIITPDYTHSRLCQSYLNRAPTVFVEKPFDANWKNVRALLEARGRAKLDTQIYALDHYRFYAWRLKEPAPSGKTLLEEATDWLGGALRTVRFFMTEEKPVEPNRVRTLQYGLLLDLLPHCFGMLSFFGQLDSVDEFEVVDVGRYRGASIPNETFAHVHFTFEDYSNNGWRVPCEAWVGKGLEKGRKYVEVIGRNGNSILITFGDTNWRDPTQGDQKIAGGIFFVSKGQLTKKAGLAPSGSRYAQLFVDMVTGERKAIISAMPLIAGERIVHALDRFWTAIQTRSTWCSYEIGDLDCF